MASRCVRACTPVGAGSGLGLSMVFGFAEQSGGHVSIDSEPGHGTTVRVYLPRASANAVVERRVPVREESFDGAEELVLVVEDDDDVRSLTVQLLRDLGYRTIEAANGAEAIEQLELQHDVALLFTDVILKAGKTGADVAKEVQRRNPDVRVLFTSGYTEDAISDHGRLDPGVDLLEKPFTKNQLGTRVAKAING
jgi:CheY-like chemotaxis protein